MVKRRGVVDELLDGFPGIGFHPEVCGGEARITNTRIPVRVLEQFRRWGASDEELLDDYPGLRPEDLANAWHYVRFHGEQIDRWIEENESDDELV
jgi:uncharacterized protein (DUF433 family)